MKKMLLTKGQVALVDDLDFEFLSKWKWTSQKTSTSFYAVRRERFGLRIYNKAKKIYMHRFILGLTDSKVKTDHKDRNGLNNQRSNLRVSTQAQNMCNTKFRTNSTSKYKGVCWVRNKWLATITKNYKHIYLGFFKNEVDAAKAYNEAAIKLQGEFATLNNV